MIIPVEALKLALSNEEESIKLYQKLSASHPEIRSILSSLLTEEQKHKELLEKELLDLID